MKRPAFQFYTGDWQGNAKLRRCSHAEKGVWIDIMCLLHDSEEYGALRWPLKDIAQAVGCKPADIKALLTKGVIKGADAGQTCEAFIYTPRHAGKDGEPVTLIPTQKGPIWYSSRMVRDEYVRTKRGIGTRFGDEPKGTNGETPKPPFGDGPSSSSSSSTSIKQPHTEVLQGKSAAAALLITPEKLGASDATAARALAIRCARPQDVLDELAGIMGKERVDKPLGLLKALLKQVEEGTFEASFAPRIQAEREHAQAQRELAQSGRSATGERASA